MGAWDRIHGSESLTRTEPSRILGRGLRALARRLLLEELGEVGGGGADG